MALSVENIVPTTTHTARRDAPRAIMSLHDGISHDRFNNVTARRIFAMNMDIDSASPEEIWTSGSLFTHPTTAQPLRFVSSSAQDTLTTGTGAWVLLVPGLDGNYNPISEFVNLAGTGGVTTVQSYLRMYEAVVVAAGSAKSNQGVITVTQQTSGLVMGAISQSPLGPASALIGNNRTLGCMYTVPAGRTARLVDITAGGIKATGNLTIEIYILLRPFVTGVFELRGVFPLASGGTTALSLDNKIPAQIPEKSDLTFKCVTSANDIGAFINYEVYEETLQ